MTAFNIVRMRPKPGEEQAWLDLHRSRSLDDLPGMVALRLVKTGGGDFFVLGEWQSLDAMVAARPAMISILDSFRHRLEDLGHGLGVTEPFSGEVVLERHA